jgi:hypothetical protein
MCARYLILLAMGVCISLPSAADAVIITSHISSDAEMNALLTDTIFVAEGRIGDRGGNATFELDLGLSTSNPDVQSNYNWQSGVTESFSLTYDYATGLVVYTLGGTVLTYSTPYAGFGDIFIRTRANVGDASIVVFDLVLNGKSIVDLSSSTGPGGLDILWISGLSAVEGFALEGIVTMTWSGNPPTNSNLAFQVKVASLTVVGTESRSWGEIKALYR